MTCQNKSESGNSLRHMFMAHTVLDGGPLTAELNSNPWDFSSFYIATRWIFSILGIQFELATQNVEAWLPCIRFSQLLTQLSPSGQLPHPEHGEESKNHLVTGWLG